MKLLAGSVEAQTDTFLHAGYLSAYPRSAESLGLGLWAMRAEQSGELQVSLVDVPAALALKLSEGEMPVETITQPTGTGIPARPVYGLYVNGDYLLVGLVFVFFAALATQYLKRLGRLWQSALVWLVVPVLMLAVAGLGHAAFSMYWNWRVQRLNQLDAPWTDVAVRQYADPEEATKVLLHGLIVSGLNGCPFEVQQLAAIQDEIAFPMPPGEWSSGMAYAAQTYGRDGWGREFSFEPLERGSYRIASAGADGAFGTRDDIVVTTAQQESNDWEQLVSNLYLRQVDDDKHVILLHRVAQPLLPVGGSFLCLPPDWQQSIRRDRRRYDARQF